jgi:hypothetical protein
LEGERGGACKSVATVGCCARVRES